MSKHRVTLKQIAEEIGVTVTTVSKALKDYPDIGKETKRKVKALAKEWNYQPDSQAQALRNQKTFTIGLILPEIVHFFFSNVIKGISDYANQKGYQIIIALSDNLTETEEKQVNLFFRNKVDGVLVSLANDTTSTEHFNQLTQFDIPVVMFDKVSESFPCSQVLIDDSYNAEVATKHLIDKGCKTVAHIRGPKGPLNSEKRFEGYVKAVQKGGLTVDEKMIKQCEHVTYEEGYVLTKELLQSDNPPAGIFAVTDQVGAGALEAAQELGVSVPDQLKVVGFSDSQIAKIAKPGLTTIHQPAYEIGETAARLLIDEIEQKGKPIRVRAEQTILDCYLIERGST